METEVKAEIKEKVLLSLTGVLAGVANGFFGGGGGMLVVPMLVLLLGREPKRAHATAILIILPLALVSGLVYTLLGSFDFAVGIPAGLGVVAGGAAGAFFLKKINNEWLVKIFAVIILAAGLRMLF